MPAEQPEEQSDRYVAFKIAQNPSLRTINNTNSGTCEIQLLRIGDRRSLRRLFAPSLRPGSGPIGQRGVQSSSDYYSLSMSAEMIMASIYSLYDVAGEGESILAILKGIVKIPTFKLRGRPCRDSHHGVVLYPAQREFADAPVQREASELWLGLVRRKNF